MVPEADVSAITSVDKKFLKKVYDVIDDNVSNELFGVEDLSSAIGLSRSQVQRKIKEITRQNPNEVIRNYRLEKSMVMLKNNSGTISEISYQVGFSSPSYFTKCFVKKFNLPPNEVVQNHKPANHMVNK
jgi:AraC-like DNA-binding protein